MSNECYMVQWMMPGEDVWQDLHAMCSLADALTFVSNLQAEVPDVKYLIFKPIDWKF